MTQKQQWPKVRGQKGLESTEFRYKGQGWKTERRLVAIRQTIESEDEKTLFPVPKYEFFGYVTNLTLSAFQIHKCYGKRSTSANWIEWGKKQMASFTVRTQDLGANSALFQTALLAYNLRVWMMWLNLPNSFHEEPNTIRAGLIQVPAKLIHRARQFILTLSKDYVFKDRSRIEWGSPVLGGV